MGENSAVQLQRSLVLSGLHGTKGPVLNIPCWLISDPLLEFSPLCNLAHLNLDLKLLCHSFQVLLSHRLMCLWNCHLEESLTFNGN